jgi:hypothetical protein
VTQNPVRVGQVSPDDRFAWDGVAWRPVSDYRWEPSAATHLVQLLAGAYLLLAGLFELVLATLSHDYVRQSTMAAVQRQSANLSPEELRRIVEASVSVGVGAAAVVAVVYIVLGLLTLVLRPPWLFYADLVVLGLVALGVPLAAAELLGGNPGPPAFFVPNLILSLLSLALFAWMLLLRVRVGPWACRKTADL